MLLWRGWGGRLQMRWCSASSPPSNPSLGLTLPRNGPLVYFLTCREPSAARRRSSITSGSGRGATPAVAVVVGAAAGTAVAGITPGGAVTGHAHQAPATNTNTHFNSLRTGRVTGTGQRPAVAAGGGPRVGARHQRQDWEVYAALRFLSGATHLRAGATPRKLH